MPLVWQKGKLLPTKEAGEQCTLVMRAAQKIVRFGSANQAKRAGETDLTYFERGAREALLNEFFKQGNWWGVGRTGNPSAAEVEHRLVAHANVVKKAELGNCQEFAALVFSLMLDENIRPLAVIHQVYGKRQIGADGTPSQGGHLFVVAGMEGSANVQERSMLMESDEAIVIDAWATKTDVLSTFKGSYLAAMQAGDKFYSVYCKGLPLEALFDIPKAPSGIANAMAPNPMANAMAPNPMAAAIAPNPMAAAMAPNPMAAAKPAAPAPTPNASPASGPALLKPGAASKPPSLLSPGPPPAASSSAAGGKSAIDKLLGEFAGIGNLGK